MAVLETIINDLVIANRILAHENVVDAFGHVSHRHPDDAGLYLLSRSRSPELVTHADILTFSLDGHPKNPDGHEPYTERHIHGAIYERFPHINAVVHSHALAVLPFTISNIPLRPVIHVASHCGCNIPVWDIRAKFGDTKLLVSNMEQGRDLAATLALGDGGAVLMRGHGFAAAAGTLKDVVKTSVYLPQNAQVLQEAIRLGGTVAYLSEGEIAARATNVIGNDRAWEYWATRAGCGEYLKKALLP
jgi:HCOMODA/2-hydroxy-3-carboxy-muconic semialdehyde decarboxylase